MTLETILHKIHKMGLRNIVCRILGTICHCPIESAYKIYPLHFSVVKENRILFYSTPSFADNGKVLFKYLQDCDNGQKYEYIWLIHREDSAPKQVYPNTQFVQADSFHYRRFSLKVLKYIATSKYVFLITPRL